MALSAKQAAWVTGGSLLVVHSLLALLLFLALNQNRQAQAEMAWLLFMIADFPISWFAWEFVSQTAPFRALFDWGYNFGSGPNLRAFAIHLLFGGAQWLLVGWVLGRAFWPKVGWLAQRRARSNSTPHPDARATSVLDQPPSARAGGRER